ncbi:MAG: hypothetical protein ABIJ08_02775 [Nanoarchaeota archaeon]
MIIRPDEKPTKQGQYVDVMYVMPIWAAARASVAEQHRVNGKIGLKEVDLYKRVQKVVKSALSSPAMLSMFLASQEDNPQGGNGREFLERKVEKLHGQLNNGGDNGTPIRVAGDYFESLRGRMDTYNMLAKEGIRPELFFIDAAVGAGYVVNLKAGDVVWLAGYKKKPIVLYTENGGIATLERLPGLRQEWGADLSVVAGNGDVPYLHVVDTHMVQTKMPAITSFEGKYESFRTARGK